MPSPQRLEEAFKELFAREYQKLCRYAYTYMQDEHLAEDVVQETFIKIWENKREMILGDEIRFYLITSVRNNCITVLRKQKSQRTAFTDTTPEPDPEPSFTTRQHIEKQQEDAQKIANALNQLPPKCKEVFLLVKMQGLSYKHTAEALNISVKTVENQMGKAIKLMREFVMAGAMSVPLFILLNNIWKGIGGVSFFDVL